MWHISSVRTRPLRTIDFTTKRCEDHCGHHCSAISYVCRQNPSKRLRIFYFGAGRNGELLKIFVVPGDLIAALLRRHTLAGLYALHAVIAIALFTDICCFAAVLLGGVHSKIYWWGFWMAQVLELIMRAALALQILLKVLRGHLKSVVIAGVYLAAWLGYLLVQYLPQAAAPSMLTIAAAGNCIGSLLAVVESSRFPHPERSSARR